MVPAVGRQCRCRPGRCTTTSAGLGPDHTSTQRFPPWPPRPTRTRPPPRHRSCSSWAAVTAATGSTSWQPSPATSACGSSTPTSRAGNCRTWRGPHSSTPRTSMNSSPRRRRSCNGFPSQGSSPTTSPSCTPPRASLKRSACPEAHPTRCSPAVTRRPLGHGSRQPTCRSRPAPRSPRRPRRAVRPTRPAIPWWSRPVDSQAASVSSEPTTATQSKRPSKRPAPPTGPEYPATRPTSWSRSTSPVPRSASTRSSSTGCAPR